MTEEYFNEVYAKTKKIVLDKILSFYHINFQTAEDLLQKVYIKFYEKYPNQVYDSGVLSWLKTIAQSSEAIRTHLLWYFGFEL